MNSKKRIGTSYIVATSVAHERFAHASASRTLARSLVATVAAVALIGAAVQRAQAEESPIGAESVDRGGPPNDHCSNATVIPGNSVNYNPAPLDVSAALTTICAPVFSCAGGSVGKDVYYIYTPDYDGSIEVSTFGSNYDTVLAAYDGCRGLCGGFNCCPAPVEFACNDNYFFGSLSQINMNVEAGETYIFQVSAVNATGGEILDFDLRWFPANDACVNATPINGLVYNSPPVKTANATTDNCEAQESCEAGGVGTSNAVWYSYTPACDGFLTLDTSGSSYDTVLSVFDGCGVFIDPDAPCLLPTEIACDDDAGTGTNSRIADLPVTGGVEYLIKVADYNTSQGGGVLDFFLRFDGADPPITEITDPPSYACGCDLVTVTGTADVPAGVFAGYTLDYAPVGSSTWIEIASSTSPVVNGTLGTWNTAGLPEDDYLLRLTASSACGKSNSAVTLVYLDKQFQNLQLTGPDNGVFGGSICPHGTAWDACFEEYRVEYKPAGSPNYQPLDPAMPSYGATVINDPLTPGSPWNTVSAGLPDGDYDLRLTGITTCGITDEKFTSFTLDNTAPSAAITWPLECAGVDGVIEIIGTANDANLNAWALQYTGGSANGWVTIDSDTVPVVNDVLGVWDTTGLDPCAYTLRLLVSDKASLNCNSAINHTSEYTVSVNVGSLGDFDADNDGDVDLFDYQQFEQAFTGPLP